MRVNWTEPALEDLEAIQTYIARDSSFYARQFIERILDVATKLSFPGIGRQMPEAEERTDIRELIFQGYRIIYLTQAEHITIISVFMAAGMEDQPW